jgi:hypothetical protein
MQHPHNAMRSAQVGLPMPLVHQAWDWHSKPLIAHPLSSLLPLVDYFLDQRLHNTSQCSFSQVFMCSPWLPQPDSATAFSKIQHNKSDMEARLA